MTYWFSFASGPGGLVQHNVGDHVDRAFDGDAWLRRRYGSPHVVEVKVVLHAGTTAAVSGVRRIGGSRKRIVAELAVPAAWHEPAVAGRLGARLLGATLLALGGIGAELGLGPCPLRASSARLRRPDFPAPGRGPDSGAAERAAERLIADLPGGTLLLVAGDEAGEEPSWHRAVAARLRATPLEHADAAEVSAWTGPIPG